VKRREFVKLALGSVALPFVSRRASALDYPVRPVHILVGQAAGSSSDISARLVGQYLSEHLGQQFVVEIRPGATGNVATEAVVRSAPDG
jgi:tripartite-type tricarboxylate transporter receptor subunit TctC